MLSRSGCVEDEEDDDEAVKAQQDRDDGDGGGRTTSFRSAPRHQLVPSPRAVSLVAGGLASRHHVRLPIISDQITLPRPGFWALVAKWPSDFSDSFDFPP